MHLWLITTHKRDERTKTDTYKPDCVCYRLKEAEILIENNLEYGEDNWGLKYNGHKQQVDPDIPIEDLWQEDIISKVDFMEMRSEFDKRDSESSKDHPDFAEFSFTEREE